MGRGGGLGKRGRVGRKLSSLGYPVYLDPWQSFRFPTPVRQVLQTVRKGGREGRKGGEGGRVGGKLTSPGYPLSRSVAVISSPHPCPRSAPDNKGGREGGEKEDGGKERTS